jgi:hypothetical protein
MTMSLPGRGADCPLIFKLLFMRCPARNLHACARAPPIRLKQTYKKAASLAGDEPPTVSEQPAVFEGLTLPEDVFSESERFLGRGDLLTYLLGLIAPEDEAATPAAKPSPGCLASPHELIGDLRGRLFPSNGSMGVAAGPAGTDVPDSPGSVGPGVQGPSVSTLGPGLGVVAPEDVIATLDCLQPASPAAAAASSAFAASAAPTAPAVTPLKPHLSIAEVVEISTFPAGASGPPRVIAVSGTAGVGKSALLREVSVSIRPFPHGGRART